MPHMQREVQVLEANVVRITDLNGNVRIELGCEPDGSPQMKLYDREGRPRLVVGVDDEAASVSLVSTTGEKQVDLTASTDRDEAAMHVNNRDGIHRVTVAHNAKYDIVQILDPDGYDRVAIFATQTVGAGIDIRDQSDDQVIAIRVQEGRTSHITIRSEEGGTLIISCGADGSMEMTEHRRHVDDTDGVDPCDGDGSQDGATDEASRTSSSVVDALVGGDAVISSPRVGTA